MQYEYVQRGGFSPHDTIKYGVNDTFLGSLTRVWHTPGTHTANIIGVLVQDGNIDVLDWLAANTPFVERREKKPARLTVNDVWLHYEPSGSAVLRVKWHDTHMDLIEFIPGKSGKFIAKLIGDAYNDIIETENGRMKIAP